jgi:hypothetical protein
LRVRNQVDVPLRIVWPPELIKADHALPVAEVVEGQRRAEFLQLAPLFG